jgi:hypothetical protein
MSRTRVEIDLNSKDADGLTRTRLTNASRALSRGEIVTAFESEDGVQALAMVDHVDDRYAFLIVNRDTMCDDNGAEVMAKGHHGHSVNRAQATITNHHAKNRVGSTNVVQGASFVDISSKYVDAESLYPRAK